MESIESRKIFIKQRREELAKRYGSDPHIYSSGKIVDPEKEFPLNMRINLNRKTIEHITHK